MELEEEWSLFLAGRRQWKHKRLDEKLKNIGETNSVKGKASHS